MSLIRLRNIQVGFGGPLLLENLNLSIESGERLCLLGRNGTGKSTLLKVIAQIIKVDSGEVEYQQNLKLAVLEQEPKKDLTGSIFDVVAMGLGNHAILLQNYHHALHEYSEDNSEKNANTLQQAQDQVDLHNVWQLNQQVEESLSRMQLDGDAEYGNLSGGMKRRVLLARALVTKPDILLLDEPTNHLDLSAIKWLEETILGYKGAVVFITHDRAFMRKLATRIVELDRGKLTSYPGNYSTYLQRKEEALHAEEVSNALFDKKLAQEEVWIRQGIKARRTRNEGRVRDLEKMRKERSLRRQQMGKVNMQAGRAERSGKLVAETENMSFSYDGQTIINGFSLTILRGDKIAVVGPNGAGKTTLLQVLLGKIKPDSGTIQTGTKLEIAYFDQFRTQLDETETVLDNLSQGREFIEINGARKHVIGYLQDFLFAPERARSPITALSGGERNRLLLAKLFSTPSNVLVLDEPTNDLDIETLELLEELVMQYQGTILLVSHDREFINNVVASTLVFEGNGIIEEYVGGYDDSQRQIKEKNQAGKRQQQKNKIPLENKKNKVKDTVKTKKKLSYKEQQELKSLPSEIERHEVEVEKLQSEIATDSFFKQDKKVIVKTQNKLAEVQNKLSHCYQRWELLEG